MKSPMIVVDASFALALVLDHSYSREVQDLWIG